MSKDKFKLGERVIIQIPDLNGKLINETGYVLRWFGFGIYTIAARGFTYERSIEEIMKYPKIGDTVVFQLAVDPGRHYKKAMVIESPPYGECIGLVCEGYDVNITTTVDRIKFMSDEGESESECVKQSNEVLYNRLVVLISDRDKVNKQLTSIESEMDCIIKQLAKEIK